MNTTARISIICVAIACVSIAATSSTEKRLTVKRIAELTAPTDAPQAKAYKVAISGIGTVKWPAAVKESQIELTREFRYPDSLEAPKTTSDASNAVLPTTPTSFGLINTGWTVHLKATVVGKLVRVYGVADYVEVEIVPGGYGAVAGPIYNEQGALLTENKLDQPKSQTTTTRFNIFAVPGETYDVTLYHGSKSEKHSVTVTAE